MKKFVAGAMLVFLVLLGAFSFSGIVHASSAENSAVMYETTENSENADSDDSEGEEEAEVLGEKRDQSDKFVLGIEIAISLTFAIGLIAASHGADVK
ncbi:MULTISPECIES: hypothetical protein [unclassified Butyrivibrio]|uniref:hypothetical protein n=1 Tax=unclassified Butyrivibrio TaxID=2639466 RepID=UPI0004233D12|nr:MULTISPECIES: hypothetical protein [unclassified Butyrivibrio]SEL45186.1 hypothetical protein SAMN04487770_110103 [Butyrivibrio sp. ob235]